VLFRSINRNRIHLHNLHSKGFDISLLGECDDVLGFLASKLHWDIYTDISKDDVKELFPNENSNSSIEEDFAGINECMNACGDNDGDEGEKDNEDGDGDGSYNPDHGHISSSSSSILPLGLGLALGILRTVTVPHNTTSSSSTSTTVATSSSLSTSSLAKRKRSLSKEEAEAEEAVSKPKPKPLVMSSVRAVTWPTCRFKCAKKADRTYDISSVKGLGGGLGQAAKRKYTKRIPKVKVKELTVIHAPVHVLPVLAIEVPVQPVQPVQGHMQMGLIEMI